MLATGSSMVATIDLLKKPAAKKSAPWCWLPRLKVLQQLKQHTRTTIYTASIDERLDDHGYIIPGLGDASDKIFGTKQKDV